MSLDALRDEVETLLATTCGELRYRWERHPEALSWRIYPDEHRSIHRCYDLQALPDCGGLLFFYGNTDAGFVPRLTRRCIHIPFIPPVLARYTPSMATMLREILSDPTGHPPNAYGMT